MKQDFTPIAQQLQKTFNKAFYDRAHFIPIAKEVVDLFEGFRALLSQYTLCPNAAVQAEILQTYYTQLQEHIFRSFCLLCQEKADCTHCRQKAQGIAAAFIRALPDIQKLLMTDLRAAYQGDPAAVSEIETLLCYPGIQAITFQRMAHFLYQQGVRIVPRIITEYAHSMTGIDIHPGAEIGRGFFIDHGTGVVIGETCVIGENVKLYQGVTLGAKSFPLDENGHPVKGIKRHPNLQDDVIIYAETTILGPVTIGKASIIGANKWITQDIPPFSKVH